MPEFKDRADGKTEIRFKEKVTPGEAIVFANQAGYIHNGIRVDNSGKHTKLTIG